LITGLPFLGYLPFLKDDLSAFSQLSDTYGDILHLKFGSKDAVVLGSIEAVKKAFVDQSEMFSGRGDVCMMKGLWNDDKGNGVFQHRMTRQNFLGILLHFL
jgi:Cytochrome P450